MDDETKLTIQERPSGVIHIQIHGDLDSMGTRMVDSEFASAVPDRNSTVVVDLNEVGFISSAGMALLLVKGKALRQGGGSMVIAAASDRVYEVLSLAGFNELFNVYSTSDEAFAALE